MSENEKTFEELAKDKTGTIYVDRHQEGYRFIIMRGPNSLCAYVGVPKEHPLADINYDNLPISCHGGLTFGGGGGGKGCFPENYYWYGWDYSHFNDAAFYSLDPRYAGLRDMSTNKHWTVGDVQEDVWEALTNFAALISLAEKIAAKSIQNNQ